MVCEDRDIYRGVFAFLCHGEGVFIRLQALSIFVRIKPFQTHAINTLVLRAHHPEFYEAPLTMVGDLYY